MSYTMRLTGSTPIDVRYKPWPQPKVSPNVTHKQDAAGRWLPCDRGVEGDFWDAEVTLFGVKSDMEAFATWLDEQGTNTFTVSQVSGVVFSPLLFQESSFTACILDIERIKRVFWAAVNNGVDEVSFTLRAIEPSFYDTTASLSTLRLKPQDERDSSWATTPNFYENGGTPVFQNREDRAGQYVGKFMQTTAEARAILRYLMDGDGRSSVITFPSIGVTYPFGPRAGTSPQCRVRDWSHKREGLNVWEFEIEFVEETT